MTTAATPVAPRPRRWFVPQFSLRALLVVVTLSAIGTAVWYRWPIKEETDIYARLSPGMKALWKPENMTSVRTVVTYHRVWGGKKVRHGWTRRYHANGQLVSEVLWREGVQHGPSRSWFPDGKLRREGANSNGKQDGLWQEFGRDGKLAKGVSVQHYQLGIPHGAWEIRDGAGNIVNTLEFSQGLVSRINNRIVDDPLIAKALAGQVDSRTHKTLLQNSEIEFAKTPLNDVIRYEAEAHGIHIRFAPSARDRCDAPVTMSVNSVPLSAALVLVVEPLGLSCDYRYGCVQIVSAADAENWRDRTGVSEIKPRPDSALARQWEQPVRFDFVETGLSDVMRYVNKATGVPIDVSVEKPLDQTPITIFLNNLSLKSSMGIFCERFDLHVRQDGDTLVIEPRENSAFESAKR